MIIRYRVVTRIRSSALIPHQNRTYYLKYFKDEIVKASKGSLGIMTFAHRREAEEWCSDLYEEMILRVEPIGRGSTPEAVSVGLLANDLRAFYSGKACQRVLPPAGTICYPVVKVLD